jgi:hypothetical protein
MIEARGHHPSPIASPLGLCQEKIRLPSTPDKAKPMTTTTTASKRSEQAAAVEHPHAASEEQAHASLAQQLDGVNARPTASTKRPPSTQSATGARRRQRKPKTRTRRGHLRLPPASAITSAHDRSPLWRLLCRWPQLADMPTKQERATGAVRTGSVRAACTSTEIIHVVWQYWLWQVDTVSFSVTRDLSSSAYTAASFTDGAREHDFITRRQSYHGYVS